MLRNTDLLRSSALLLGTVAASAALSSAQSNLYTFQGDGTEDRMGTSVAAAGDVNNDNFPDVIVGAPEDFNVFALKPGYARVYSGLDGSVILDLTNGGSENNGERFGSAVDGIGDINGDGFDDVIVGAPGESTNGPGAGEARVLSGQNGQQLFSVKGNNIGFSCGAAVSGAGDVNNDSVPDFIVGYPGASQNGGNSGMVRVFSGATGGQLFEVLGQNANQRFGISVDSLDDINGDGFDDVIVGSYYDGARVLSGADGTTLRHFTVASQNDFFGFSVRGIADVTGDSIADVMVGAIQPTVFTANGVGYAKVLDSVTSAELHHFVGTSTDDEFGTDVDLAGDFNGDGVLDFLVAAAQSTVNQPGYARIYSGIGGVLLATYNGSASQNMYGESIAYLGDLNGDGTDEFAVGEPHESSTLFIAGRVSVESGGMGACPVPSKYCTPLPNSTGAPSSINFLGTNSIANNDLFLTATGLPPNQTGVFYYGGGPNNVPWGNGIRCVSQGVFRLPVSFIDGGGATLWQLDVTSPPQPAGQITAGSTWYFQYWHRDPAAGGTNTNLSDGLMVPFCP